MFATVCDDTLQLLFELRVATYSWLTTPSSSALPAPPRQRHRSQRSCAGVTSVPRHSRIRFSISISGRKDRFRRESPHGRGTLKTPAIHVPSRLVSGASHHTGISRYLIFEIFLKYFQNCFQNVSSFLSMHSNEFLDVLFYGSFSGLI